MAGYQAGTFHCAPSVQICKLVGCCLVAKKTATTFFLISCIKCLWDLVGHFLGLPFKTRKPLPAGHSGLSFVFKTRGRCERFK